MKAKTKHELAKELGISLKMLNRWLKNPDYFLSKKVRLSHEKFKEIYSNLNRFRKREYFCPKLPQIAPN